jgi:GNAT superfamily N-acetyltransferase
MVEIKEVTTKKDLKKWVEFPNVLYKGVKAYVPFLTIDEIGTFTKEENPAHEYCDTKLLLAYKDGKIVGRIGGIINHAANKKWEQNRIRFTRFDFVDDFEVSKALFDEIVKWGKEKGYSQIIGPIGFHDMDHEGMLIEGFDELNMSITFYNHPYYIEHMQKLGLEKDIDWVEFQLKVPEKVNPKLERLNEFLSKRLDYEIVRYNDVKVLEKDAYKAFKVIDEAFSVLYGTVPLTDEVIEKTIKDNIPLMNLKYITSIKDKEGELIGFAVLVPSIAKALKKSNGKIFPFGLFRMLKALRGKNDTLEMFFVAIKPEHQSKGIPVILINEMIKVCIENGIKYCETGPELETNKNVQSMWRNFDDVRQHKRRRCWIKEI